ncbi:protein-export chaperone SecB [Metapseudomonas otitidis]|uniref:protein-export chaperone SecB n=1 Tax=Metapseudomonas otitidis TaxID=319939 RepID=UPI0013F5D957|nr:protein-export chaperone SecB [Pseudomonas otitidis]
MKINMVSNRVLRLLIAEPEILSEAVEDEVDDRVDRGHANFTTKVDFEADFFYVVFDLTLRTKEDNRVINVVYRSEFKTDNPIDSEFRKTDFPYVNAPAIAYPYLRAFVSNLTLNSGYSPVMLPSVNFVAMKDRVIRPDE